jgi:hypothetical protein
VESLIFTPNNKTLIVVDNNDLKSLDVKPASIKIYDISDTAHPRRITELFGDVFNADVSPDGHLLAAGGGATNFSSGTSLIPTTRSNNRLNHLLSARPLCKLPFDRMETSSQQKTVKESCVFGE